jgi:type I restriction enzyme M protein
MSRRHILLPDSLASLFRRLEELVLANSGEDDFEEIFKLLVAKLWSERSGSPAFRVHGSSRETFAALSALLEAASRGWPGLFTPGEGFRLSAQHLHACVDTLAGHSLLEAGGEALDASFEYLTARAAKGRKGQFFTPRQVVDFCVRMARPRPGETVLDPACGSGAFLLHTLSYLRETGGSAAGHGLWGFDFDGRAIRVARALMLVAGGSQARLVRLNSLGRARSGSAGKGSGETVEAALATSGGPERGFDLVLTNPPFAGEIREPALLESYQLGAGRARQERDVLFLERCIELLRPGGRLAIVLPHNKLAAASFAPLRQWLIERVRLVAVIGLGRNTFLPHTSQKASVLFGVRRAGGRPSADEPIFFGVSEREGKDRQGAPIFRGGRAGAHTWRDLDHDLGELLPAFEQHLAAHRIAWGAEG